MSSEKDSYAWLALAARLWWKDDEDEDGKAKPAMVGVFAQAGVFTAPNPRAANDMIGALVLFCVLMYLISAKSRANFAVNRSCFCKINGRPNFSASPSIPRQLVPSALFLLLVASAKTITSPQRCATFSRNVG